MKTFTAIILAHDEELVIQLHGLTFVEGTSPVPHISWDRKSSMNSEKRVTYQTGNLQRNDSAMIFRAIENIILDAERMDKNG